jgi:hypothetical protein
VDGLVKRTKMLLRDLVAPAGAAVLLAVVVVVSGQSVDRSGYERGVKVAEARAFAERAGAVQAAYDKGWGDGITEGVARVLGGYKSGRCRITTDLPRANLTGQPAPVGACVAVSWRGKSGIYQEDFGPTPTPLPTPEAQGR